MRAQYPRARILVLEPFGALGLLTLHVADAIRAAAQDVGNPRTEFIPTRGWLGPADTDPLHPSAAGQAKAAARLIEVVRSRIAAVSAD